MSAREALKTTGVWTWVDAMSAGEAVETAGRIESLGYSALWLPETTGRDPFATVSHLAANTSTLMFATGIANIFNRHPGAMRQSGDSVAELTGGRFVLGMGVSHAPLVAGLRQLDYSKPLSQMKTYLDAMDQSPYTGPSADEAPLRVLAALGPKMLALAAERSDGAHPYWTTPEHTAMAAEILGPDKLLCVEQKVVLSTDTAAAREAGATQLARYKALPNYRNNWKRMGYTEEQIEHDEPSFVDAVVAWGTADQIQERIDAHYAAGATHVCIQPVSVEGPTVMDWECLEALAPS